MEGGGVGLEGWRDGEVAAGLFVKLCNGALQPSRARWISCTSRGRCGRSGLALAAMSIKFTRPNHERKMFITSRAAGSCSESSREKKTIELSGTPLKGLGLEPQDHLRALAEAEKLVHPQSTTNDSFSRSQIRYYQRPFRSSNPPLPQEVALVAVEGGRESKCASASG